MKTAGGRILTVLMVLGFFVAGAAPARGKVARGITRSQCEAETRHLLKIIQIWSRKNHCSVSTNPWDFWNHIYRVNRWRWEIPTERLAEYFAKEDGAVAPVRTGYEVSFYNEFKRYVATHRGQKITLGHVLWMGLDACRGRNGGDANLPLAFLTIHNVIRAMARPEQWCGPPLPGDYGHPPSDPMYSIFLDLLGKGRYTLPHIMRSQGLRLRIGKNGVTDGTWTRALFDSRVGVFQTLKGARNAMWNGGCHYYYWIGATTEMILGQLFVHGGAFFEMRAKSGLGQTDQGAVELTHFYCGATLGNSVRDVKGGGGEQRRPQSSGNYCRGHQLYCKEYGKLRSYPRSAYDRNMDNRCDLCGKPYLLPNGKLAPGLYAAMRGDVTCRPRLW